MLVIKQTQNRQPDFRDGEFCVLIVSFSFFLMNPNRFCVCCEWTVWIRLLYSLQPSLICLLGTE